MRDFSSTKWSPAGLTSSKSLEGAADAIPLGWAHPSTHKGISILLTKLHVLICHRMTGFGSGKMLPNTAQRATIRKRAFQMTFMFFPERRVVHRNFWMDNYVWSFEVAGKYVLNQRNMLQANHKTPKGGTLTTWWSVFTCGTCKLLAYITGET